MEEVRQIVELLENAGKAVMIIKNVFKIQDEIPYFTISPNETGQFILDDVPAFIRKYNIKDNIDDEDLEEAAKDDNHCAFGWIDKTGEDFERILEDLFIKLPTGCRRGTTARFIRRAKDILSLLGKESGCTKYLLMFVKYGEKERFHTTPSDEKFSVDELMNLCISLLVVAGQMLFFLGQIYFDFTGRSIMELAKITLKDTENLNMTVFEEYSEKPKSGQKGKKPATAKTTEQVDVVRTLLKSAGVEANSDVNLSQFISWLCGGSAQSIRVNGLSPNTGYENEEVLKEKFALIGVEYEKGKIKQRTI